MKIGISIKPILKLICPLEDIQEFLESIFAELDNLRYIEVNTNDLDNITLYLLNLAKKFKIKYSIHCPHMYSKEKINFCSNSKKDIKKADLWLKKSIKYAKKLNAKHIIIHPDVPKNCEKEKAISILKMHITNNLKYLNRTQKILVENMPNEKYPLSTPTEFKHFFKNFGRKVAFCWDVGHEIVRFKNQKFAFPHLLKSKLKEVHISGILNFHDHYPLTKGNLDLYQCIQSLKKINFKGPIVLEIVTKNPLDIINSKKEIDKFI